MSTKNNKGLSLIEIIISLLILALIVAPFTSMFIQSKKMHTLMEKELKAIYAVRNEIEIIMSLNSREIYSQSGIRSGEDFVFKTSIKPYSPSTHGDSFLIIFKTPGDGRDEILVFTPDGFKTFSVNDNPKTQYINISFSGSTYFIGIGDEHISGKYEGNNKPNIEINLIEKSPEIFYNIDVMGLADLRVYEGDDSGWTFVQDLDYLLLAKRFYRDYSIFRVRVDAFEDLGMNSSIFDIETLICVPN